VQEDQINIDKAAMQKTLPRLPSAPVINDEDDDAPTPRPAPASLPDELQGTSAEARVLSEQRVDLASPPDTRVRRDKPLPSISLSMLGGLRRAFRQTEQALYEQLAETPGATLNDVRRSFEAAARGAAKRLAVWESKHVRTRAEEDAKAAKASMEEPPWWGKTYHAIPGGSVIVREDDWGSIIAFTLRSVSVRLFSCLLFHEMTSYMSSSQDYLRELANFSITARTGASPPSAPATPTATRRSYFPSGSALKFFRASEPQPDPDEEGVVWYEPEACSAVISRKQHPRDPSSLLTLQLRKKTLEGQAGAFGLPNPSVLRAFVAGGSSGGSSIPPPSAYAKPAVQVSLQAADGQVGKVAEGAELGETAGKLLHELEALPDSGTKGSSLFTGFPSTSGFFSASVQRHGSPSILSSASQSRTSLSGSQTTVGPPPPPKDSSNTTEAPQPSKPEDDGATTSYAATITTSITNAMKFVASGRRADPPPARNHHGLLSADFAAIDERPHVKYDWTIGKRLKFSCTVYYARQFDALRRRCAVEDVFLRSMEHSANWIAEGGKSKSNFWKTADDRFIIKTLVNAWNVADL
jgi:1-phosphatidylinositol-3-phosphate 5-kinase